MPCLSGFKLYSRWVPLIKTSLKHYITSFEPNKKITILEALKAFVTYIYKDNNGGNDNANTWNNYT